MLVNRIKYLTGNFTVGNIADLTPIKSGVYFNYKMISESEKERQLRELNLYYNKMLHCKKGSFGYKLSSLLSKEQKKDCLSILFILDLKIMCLIIFIPNYFVK